jgi:hypothetical protein
VLITVVRSVVVLMLILESTESAEFASVSLHIRVRFRVFVRHLGKLREPGEVFSNLVRTCSGEHIVREQNFLSYSSGEGIAREQKYLVASGWGSQIFET